MPTVLPGLVKSCGSMVAICSVARVVPELTGGFHFCQTEIENFGMAAFGDENISGLDVAVNDSLPVSGVERVGDFYGDRKELFGVQRTAIDLMLESDAIQKFHRDEALLTIFSDFINSANVGMVQCGRGAGFTAKTLEGLRVARNIVRQKFQGDETAELGVFGFVDDAHATTA